MKVEERILTVKIPDNKGLIPIVTEILGCVNRSKCAVFIKKDNRTVSGGSMIGMLSLCITNGDKLTVSCSGEDEETVALCLKELSNILC